MPDLSDFKARDEGGKGRFCPFRFELEAWARDEERVSEAYFEATGRRIDAPGERSPVVPE